MEAVRARAGGRALMVVVQRGRKWPRGDPSAPGETRARRCPLRGEQGEQSLLALEYAAAGGRRSSPRAPPPTGPGGGRPSRKARSRADRRGGAASAPPSLRGNLDSGARLHRRADVRGATGRSWRAGRQGEGYNGCSGRRAKGDVLQRCRAVGVSWRSAGPGASALRHPGAGGRFLPPERRHGWARGSDSTHVADLLEDGVRGAARSPA